VAGCLLAVALFMVAFAMSLSTGVPDEGKRSVSDGPACGHKSKEVAWRLRRRTAACHQQCSCSWHTGATLVRQLPDLRVPEQLNRPAVNRPLPAISV